MKSIVLKLAMLQNVTIIQNYISLPRILALICILLYSTQWANTQSVTLDPTFGQDGKLIIPEAAELLFLDFDKKGNIIALGKTFVSFNSHLTIVKTSADGIMDNSFGENGIVRLKGYSASWPYGLKITKENKILVRGNAAEYEWKAIYPLLVQFNEDGSMDENFGDNGKIILNYDNLINLEHDDFILTTSNSFISKYNYQGEIDVTFGENGKRFVIVQFPL